MSHILTLFTFPQLAMVIWCKDDLIQAPCSNSASQNPRPTAYVMHSDAKPACEILLPTLWHQLSHNHAHITTIATLHEPGPFTATRAGQSFAKGMASPEWTVFSTSFFDLLEPEQQEKALMDTGGHHWVNRYGNVISQTIAPVYGISGNTCTESDLLRWSKRLATLCFDFEKNKAKTL
jgi:hypothetical protein